RDRRDSHRRCRPRDVEGRGLLRRDLRPARRGAHRGHRRDRAAALPRAAQLPGGKLPQSQPQRDVPASPGRGPQGAHHDQVAELEPQPFPPGRYPLIVVGSGPGGLQLTYCLRRLGIEHAVLSQDEAPGGMFRRWPVFQRMLSWTKPFTGFDRHSREYERYDWNSLLAEEEMHRGVMPEVMDGSSYFPSRPEMERGLALFAGRTGLRVRYRCGWETTRKDSAGDFVLGTTDGEYRAPILVFAV